MLVDCGCPQGRGRSVTDPDRHAAWHALALAQLGVPYEGDPELLRRVRGAGGRTDPGETLVDRRKRNGGRRT